MPFDGPPYLSEQDIALIVEWIRQGARDATGTAAPLPVGAEIRLHGELTTRWMLDALPLQGMRDARLDKSPVPGDYVEMRGRIGSDGAIVVERLRPR